MSEPGKNNYANRAEQVEHLPSATRAERLRKLGRAVFDETLFAAGGLAGASVGIYEAHAHGWSPTTSAVAVAAGYLAVALPVHHATTGDRRMTGKVQKVADKQQTSHARSDARRQLGDHPRGTRRDSPDKAAPRTDIGRGRQ